VGTVGTTNVGSRALTCPLFIIVLRERGSTAIYSKRPRSGRGSDRFPDGEITFLGSSQCAWIWLIIVAKDDRVG
jgi:hypothetical protein